MPTAPVPENEPSQIRAGETLLFSKSLPDFPANDSPAWAITYNLRAAAGDKIDFTSSADGSWHKVEVAYTTTANWKAGTYYGVGIVSNGTQAVQVWSGRVEVLPNLAEAGENFDPRTQARRTLDNINAVLEGRATSEVLNSNIEGVDIQRLTFTELLKLKDRYEVIVAAEERAAGGGRSKTVFAHFTSTR